MDLLLDLKSTRALVTQDFNTQNNSY